MVILVSTLFMVFFILGYMTAMLTIKIIKNYITINETRNEKTTGEPQNETQDLISEWLYGEQREKRRIDIDE